MKNFTVYGYQDLLKPDMWYIGKTIQPLSHRDKDHRNSNKTIFDRHYRKYPLRFSLRILKECFSDIEMNQWEKIFITQFDSIWPNGYNFTSGGDSGHVQSEEAKRKNSESHRGEKNHFYGKKHSQETKDKISAHHLGKKLSEETRNKILAYKRSHPHPMLGRNHSEESKKKMSIGHIGQCAGEKNIGSKLKECQVIEIRNKFMSGMGNVELAKEYDVCRGTVWKITSGKIWKHTLV